MRFIENGPSIPGELLTARDEGRLVLFCGSGVSKARARLSDFFGLAEDVIQRLGVTEKSAASRILAQSRESVSITGGYNLISIDQVFGSLEHEFESRYIESAIAQALKPLPDVDLSAHRILLDLATTQQNKVLLVTTNFDRLFEECNEEINIWEPPRLPDISRFNELDGVVYLHGRANTEYSGSEGGFVLSSSGFGRAYLSEGWATAFFREVVDRYNVLFVGYSADDPPVRYLLEGLNSGAGQLRGVYAFQPGNSAEAIDRWHHKGVEAIPYSEDQNHSELWETLEAWAVRARAPDKWLQSVITLAKKGPQNLKPHERGQVAHVVSTLRGIQEFSRSDPPPTPEWLCVFDPNRRYARPEHIGRFDSKRTYIDPFVLFGLDSDVSPIGIDADDHYAKRETPSCAWDAFSANQLDHLNLGVENHSALRGHWASNIPRLPARLNQLGFWISKVANQPASVWWAAGQTGLHPDICHRIKREIASSENIASLAVRRAWYHLFEIWDRGIDDFWSEFYKLESEIKKDGWDRTTVRKYTTIFQPYLKISQGSINGPVPPPDKANLPIQDLVRLDVEYPTPPSELIIPDEWLGFALGELRKNLEHALNLESELGGYGLQFATPIFSDSHPDANQYGRTEGLSASVIRFSEFMLQLVGLDLALAQQELATWPASDDTIFSRLKIWACGNSELVPSRGVDDILKGLSDVAFWDSYHQRDLLHVLASRWGELPSKTRQNIEQRLLNGPTKWEKEEDLEYEERKAWASLNRLMWLESRDCAFSLNMEIETAKLKQAAPKWKLEYSDHAADSMEGRGGNVEFDTSFSSLLDEPLLSIVSLASELGGRTDDFLVEKAPFRGLSGDRPVRAFSALSHLAKQGEFPEWAWRTFLNHENRKTDNPKISALIAKRVSRYPDNAVIDFIYSLSTWVREVSEKLALHSLGTFEKVILKLIHVIGTQPSSARSNSVRGNKEPDWAGEALNSPVGKIAQALFDDPRKNNLKPNDGLPKDWLILVEGLLLLDGDSHRHALVIFAYNLNWFYSIDPVWSEANLLSIIDGKSNEDKAAFWAGFLWGAKVPNIGLYTRIKPALLLAANELGSKNDEKTKVLAGIILAGWGTKVNKPQKELVSNQEMLEVLISAGEEFRSHILWRLEEWAKDKGENSHWAEKLPEFLKDVWPRQKSVKTPMISARLCELAFSNAERFHELSEIILPLLMKVKKGHLNRLSLQRSDDQIVNNCPSQVLALLYAVLPYKATDWPWHVEEIVWRTGEVDEKLKLDERFVEIQRRWNAR